MSKTCFNTIDCFKLNFLSLEKFINLDEVIYFTQASGCLYYDNIRKSVDNFIIVIKNNNKLNATNRINGQSIHIDPGIHIINDFIDIELMPDVQVLLVNLDFYNNLASASADNGFITKINESMIISLFDSINKSSRPEYEIKALANLIGVDVYKRHVHRDYEKIKQAINEYCKNPRFNLDLLCSLVHMSRRKVQYVLSDHNTSFIDLTQLIRLRELKQQIKLEPRSTLINLVEKCGFRNVGMAKRAFIKHYNIELSDYKKSILDD